MTREPPSARFASYVSGAIAYRASARRGWLPVRGGTTSLGAGCFLACALATLLTGRTLKSPRLRRVRKLEREAKRIAI
jgi:hypothetical protein